MKEKIEWYQEVLELEPGSKVFFPLARLLADSDQLDRAVQTLRHGLDRHPEFIEARLYLIDLLFRHGRLEQCKEQVGHLAPLFSRYEGFWQAWGSTVAATGQEGDAGLALKFLAAAFSQRSLSLADVLSRGLESVLEKEARPPAHAATGMGTAAVASIVTHAPRGPVPSTAQAMHAPLPDVAPLGDAADEGVSEAACGDISAKDQRDERVTGQNAAWVSSADAGDDDALALSSGSPLEASDSADDGDEPEERFSLRTRSMAEVLAEQGDYAGALEIYQELSSQASSPEEAADLQYRISTLTAHLGAVQEPAPAPEPVASPGKHRVLTVLEALAERLENRVHG